MKTKKVVHSIISVAVSVLTDSAGFNRTTREDFHRRLGSCVQVVNFQRSRMDVGKGDMFYVNIGIAFDELAQHLGTSVNEKPMAHECHFQSRMEDLVPDSPKWWVVSESSLATQFFKRASHTRGNEIVSSEADREKVGEYLVRCIVQTVSELDEIDSPRALLSHRWKEVPSAQVLVPLLAYVVGDYDRAWSEIQRIAEKFSDRQGMQPPEVVSRLRLEKLKDRLISKT